MVDGGDTSNYGLYGEAPPERGTFFRFQVYKKGRDLFVALFPLGIWMGSEICFLISATT